MAPITRSKSTVKKRPDVKTITFNVSDPDNQLVFSDPESKRSNDELESQPIATKSRRPAKTRATKLKAKNVEEPLAQEVTEPTVKSSALPKAAKGGRYRKQAPIAEMVEENKSASEEELEPVVAKKPSKRTTKAKSKAPVTKSSLADEELAPETSTNEASANVERLVQTKVTRGRGKKATAFAKKSSDDVSNEKSTAVDDATKDVSKKTFKKKAATTKHVEDQLKEYQQFAPTIQKAEVKSTEAKGQKTKKMGVKKKQEEEEEEDQIEDDDFESSNSRQDSEASKAIPSKNRSTRRQKTATAVSSSVSTRRGKKQVAANAETSDEELNDRIQLTVPAKSTEHSLTPTKEDIRTIFNNLPRPNQMGLKEDELEQNFLPDSFRNLHIKKTTKRSASKSPTVQKLATNHLTVSTKSTEHSPTPTKEDIRTIFNSLPRPNQMRSKEDEQEQNFLPDSFRNLHIKNVSKVTKKSAPKCPTTRKVNEKREAEPQIKSGKSKKKTVTIVIQPETSDNDSDPKPKLNAPLKRKPAIKSKPKKMAESKAVAAAKAARVAKLAFKSKAILREEEEEDADDSGSDSDKQNQFKNADSESDSQSESDQTQLDSDSSIISAKPETENDKIKQSSLSPYEIKSNKNTLDVLVENNAGSNLIVTSPQNCSSISSNNDNQSSALCSITCSTSHFINPLDMTINDQMVTSDESSTISSVQTSTKSADESDEQSRNLEEEQNLKRNQDEKTNSDQNSLPTKSLSAPARSNNRIAHLTFELPLSPIVLAADASESHQVETRSSADTFNDMLKNLQKPYLVAETMDESSTTSSKENVPDLVHCQGNCKLSHSLIKMDPISHRYDCWSSNMPSFDQSQMNSTILDSESMSATKFFFSDAKESNLSVREEPRELLGCGFSWNGQIGASMDNYWKMSPIELSSHLTDVQSKFGHTACLDKESQVWTFGSNESFSLGRDTSYLENPSFYNSIPMKLPDLDYVIKVDVGKTFTAMLDQKGVVKCVGAFCDTKYNRVIGLQPEVSGPSVKPIQLPGEYQDLACGKQFLLLLTKTGHVCSLGIGSKGELGRLSAEKASIFQMEHLLPDQVVFDFESSEQNQVKIDRIWCTHNSAFARTEDGRVFAWGNNEHQQLGLGQEFNELIPEIVYKPLEVKYFYSNEISVSKIVGGKNHTIALDTKGSVHTFGCNKFGQLGNGQSPDCDHTDDTEPLKIEGFNDKTVVDIACGKNTSFAVSQDGRVHSWGLDCPQLGHGYHIDSDVIIPKVIENKMLKSKHAIAVTAGAGHLLITVVDKKMNGN